LRFNDDATSTIKHMESRKPTLNAFNLASVCARMTTGHQYDLPYLVEQWDDSDSRVEELIALTGDYRVARAAFEEAVKCRPGRIVTLRQKTRLLADSRRVEK